MSHSVSAISLPQERHLIRAKRHGASRPRAANHRSGCLESASRKARRARRWVGRCILRVKNRSRRPIRPSPVEQPEQNFMMPMANPTASRYPSHRITAPSRSEPVRLEHRSLGRRGVHDAPATLKHDGELIAHTFGVDQPDDAVLVGFHSANERLSCRCANRHAASYREADRRAAKLAAGRRQLPLLTCSGAPVRVHARPTSARLPALHSPRSCQTGCAAEGIHSRSLCDAKVQGRSRCGPTREPDPGEHRALDADQDARTLECVARPQPRERARRSASRPAQAAATACARCCSEGLC